jgi:hypothetical protein
MSFLFPNNNFKYQKKKHVYNDIWTYIIGSDGKYDPDLLNGLIKRF